MSRKKRVTHELGWRDSPEAWGQVVEQAMKDLEGGAVETNSLVVSNGAYHVISVRPGTISDVKPCRHSK